jgi:hypothetical protein
MKVLGLTSTGILTFLLAVSTWTPAYGQQEQHGERQDHREPQQGGQDHAKPTPQRAQPQHAQRQQQQSQQRADQQRHDNQQQHIEQQHVQQQQQQQHAQQQQRRDQRNQQQRAQARRPQNTPQERQRVRQSAWQQHRSQNWQSDHRTWQQRGGYRIPDDRYRGYFGPSHRFRINTLPFRVVAGYPRFQYQGYWISAVDPWPEDWGNDWYNNDDVYVNYVDNGYYLYNRRYPSTGIAINITL